ncbi:ABC transporter permease [Agromyces aerolatus]|uniref:ABC transporter permease n=1 Tax=Agromyces sp. LY-1074 TaxID=3074080 RepID=UPI0028636603|nr:MULTISPECIES: ABC transporter permease [unclassified Agromyces]MDR5698765.1 ABC transporter permease [Agromyces sp. LY-1074]MDR5705059.1 ABC transporter permease [Agromyces sp. LY-1358]
MIRYILLRLGLGVVTVWGVVTLVFLAVRAVPGGPASIILQGGAGGGDVNPAAVAALEQELGLDQPILVQYVTYLGNLLRGDLGNSIKYSAPVTEIIVSPLGNTVTLVLLAIVIGGVIGLAFGLLSGNWPGSVLDRVLSGFISVAVSTPGFVIAIFLSLVIGLSLGWFPSLGYRSPEDGIGEFLYFAFLPSLALSFGFLAIVGRVTRTSILSVRREDWVRTARGMGLPPTRVFRRHVFRNAVNPVITVSGLQLGGLLGATVLIEQVFNWPGIGSTLLNAINGRDYPLVQGIVIVFAVVFILTNLLVDLLYRALDPRVEA